MRSEESPEPVIPHGGTAAEPSHVLENQRRMSENQ